MSWLKKSSSRSASSMNEGMINAINRVQAVIEFDHRGQGSARQRQFPQRDDWAIRSTKSAASITPCSSTLPTGPATEYKEFWAKLGRGEYDADQYKRIGKGGKEVWIQASYNPNPRRPRQAGQGREICHRHHRAKAQDADLRGPARGDQQGSGGDRVQPRWQDSDRQRQLPQHLGYFAQRGPRPASLDVRRARLPGEPGIPGILGQARPRRVRRQSVQAHRQGRQGSLDPGELQSDPGREAASRSRW